MWTSKLEFLIRQRLVVTLCLFSVNYHQDTIAPSRVSAQGIQGETAYCMHEGETVEIPGITNPCITCRCENYKITCQDTRKCLDHRPKECYLHLFDLTDEDRCCINCKGCDFEGEHYPSGKKWISSTDPCLSFQCADGIVTKSAQKVCYTPCTNGQIIPANGTCCPTCQGCYANGRLYNEMEPVPVADPCVSCICKGKNLICDKTACPVLACPVHLYVYDSGACCPKCHGSRNITRIENHCMVGQSVVRSGNTQQIDSCTSCTCMKSTLICKRQICPVLACPIDYQERTAGACCPRCLESAPVFCETEEATYNNGESWRIPGHPCVKNICENGHVKFTVEKCPTNTICPDDQALHKDRNSCCHKCVPRNAVCTVYGDPHYNTFDGKRFSFQGRCKYIALSECHKKQKRFEVQLRNDAKKSAHFAWTKSVAINTDQTRILLLQNLRVRVNRKTVRLPYIQLGKLSIISSGYSVVVRTVYGLKVTWDGDSYVEISMPYQFRNRVCGLCGNYNGNAADDFVIKHTGATTDDVLDFAQSWLVNKKVDAAKCLMPDTEMPGSDPRPRLGRSIPCPTHPLKKGLRVMRACSIFKSSATRACRKLISADSYYRSCLVDMCDCPSTRSCLCSSLLAFLRECERAGGNGEYIRQSNCRMLR